MKYLVALVFLLMSCISKEDEQELQKSIAYLKGEESRLSQEVNEKKNQVGFQEAILDSVNTIISSRQLDKAIAEGKKVKFILTLELRQSHMSLSIAKHIKDAMNAVTFDIAVDREMFDQVQEGTEILDSFRGGSFLVHGSLGSWTIKVKDKRVVDG